MTYKSKKNIKNRRIYKKNFWVKRNGSHIKVRYKEIRSQHASQTMFE